MLDEEGVTNLWNHVHEISYLNFDVITDRNTRDRFFQASIHDDGNKEFYLGMKSIAIVSRKQLYELQIAGFNIIFNFSPTEGCTIPPKSGIDRTEVLYRIKLAFNLIIYIISMAEPRAYDSQSFLSLYSDKEHLGPEIAKDISSLYDLENLEKNLSLEVAFIYYLNLRREFRSIPYAEAVNKDHVTLNTDSIPPMQSLVNILEADVEIAKFFRDCLNQVTKYHKELQRLMEKQLNL